MPGGSGWGRAGQGWPLVVYGHFVEKPQLSQSETAGTAVLLAHWKHVSLKGKVSKKNKKKVGIFILGVGGGV